MSAEPPDTDPPEPGPEAEEPPVRAESPSQGEARTDTADDTATAAMDPAHPRWDGTLAANPAQRVIVPTWMQMIGLPLLLVFLVFLAMATSRAVIIFLIAGLIALLLNPIVRAFTRLRVPRSIAVFVVFGAFASLVTVLSIIGVNVLFERGASVQQNLPEYISSLDDQIDDTQAWLDRRGVELDLRDQGDRFVEGIEERSSEITGDALEFSQEFVRRTAEAMLSVIAVIVITIYMLLDAPRIGRLITTMLPRNTGVERLFPRLERALFNYVRGQTLTSIVMGASASAGLYMLEVLGLWEKGKEVAVVMGIIVALTEFAPSIGPVIGSLPPLAAAAFDGLVPVVSVLILFLLLHQIEGHIVVPKLMGAAIAVHPLLVIFGILAGAQILGPGGILLALPLLAVAREMALFVRERFDLASWPDGPAAIPVTPTPPAGAAQ